MRPALEIGLRGREEFFKPSGHGIHQRRLLNKALVSTGHRVMGPRRAQSQ